MAKKIKGKSKQSQFEDSGWPFTSLNYTIFGIALVVIIIGFILLYKGSITLAPVLLILGYCVLIPIAIIIRPDSKKEKE